MRKISPGVTEVPQPSPKKPKLDEENPFPDSLPTGKSQHTTPISPPTPTENSSDARILDNLDPFEIHDYVTFGHRPHAVPEDPISQRQVHECLDFVVNKYNRLMKSNSELVQAKIVKAIRTFMGPNFHFSITFDAEDTVRKQRVTYKTVIVCRPNYRSIHVIKEEGQDKEFLYPIDLDDQNENDRMNRCAAAAIAFRNDEQQEKPRLEFVRIGKAVKDIMDLVHRMSFEARNLESGEINTYYIEAREEGRGDWGVWLLLRKDEMKDDLFLSLLDELH